LRSIAIAIGLALSIALALWAQTPDKTKTTAKTSKARVSQSKTTTSKAATSSKTTVSKTGTSKTGTSKTGASKTVAGKTVVKKPATGKKSSPTKQMTTGYRRSTQKEPAPERYKEIQQSLADKGYFAGPVNGAWGSDSVEALKRFQRDQNIGDDGKLGSLSLIALGLGPKRGTEKSENSEAGPTPP
jgi:hypothetical protein